MRLIPDDYRAVLPLAIAQNSKAPAVIGMVVVGALVVPLALMAALMPLLAGAPAPAAVFGFFVGAAVISTFGWLCLARVRQVLRPAFVTLTSDLLSVEYPVLFKEPLQVSIGVIRSATFDPGKENHRRSSLPMLSAMKQQPNAVILFDPPVAAPSLRREVAHGPLKGEALSGLQLEFADPRSAEAAFSYLGVVRQLTDADDRWIAAQFAGSSA
jgi:hypothetical protein